MQSVRRAIPTFSLYGEAAAPDRQTDHVHIEDIASRSRKYLWRIGTHRHTQLSQCIFVSAGPVTVTLDDSRAELTGPAVVIVPAGTVHGFQFRADTLGQVLTVDLAGVLSLAPAVHQPPIEFLFSRPRVIDLAHDEDLARRLAQLLDRLAGEFRQPDSWSAPVGGWLALSVLWMLAHGTAAHVGSERESSEGSTAHHLSGFHGGHDAARLRRFRHLIESQYLKHWPVERYAQRLALSESSLNRLCRDLAGTTAFDLIQQRLALEARRRLVYAGSAVSRIARELGFEDPAYFSRFFRRHSGVSPNEFRRRHRDG
jgi:AraC family transcriptional activator of pobA